ncbi:Hypothetical protein GbCGDNIH8_8376 [Granulibacter bethesdensis]|nr:Hypothetical protein GbCGDNIH8_8376 [Granulibacter bethesdensis]
MPITLPVTAMQGAWRIPCSVPGCRCWEPCGAGLCLPCLSGIWGWCRHGSMAHYRPCSRRWPVLQRPRLIWRRSCPQPFRLFCPPERIRCLRFRLRDKGLHWPGTMRSALPTRICWLDGAGMGRRSFVSHRWPISRLLRGVMRSGCPVAIRSCMQHGWPRPPASGPACSGRRSRGRCMASVVATWCSGPVWKMRRV